MFFKEDCLSITVNMQETYTEGWEWWRGVFHEDSDRSTPWL